jgi:aldoxime dehydratase
MAKNTPAGFEAPYPAWTSEFPSPDAKVVFAQIGIQGSDDIARKALCDAVAASLDGHASIVERATHIDVAGVRNDVFMTYWPTQAEMRAWYAGPASVWKDRPFDGDTGWWWEALASPVDHLETSYSVPAVTWGIGRALPQVIDPTHAYFGAMRDRIVAAEDGGLAAVVPEVSERHAVDSRGTHVTVSAPGNLCLIRTVQGWNRCGDEERERYLSHVHPVYEEGVRFLAGEPAATGCLSARLVVDEPLIADQQIQTETLAWFLSLRHLEEWTHSHPTHLKIFNGFLEHAMTFGFQIDVVLGHEVVVVPAGDLDAEYANCHGATGLLGWF